MVNQVFIDDARLLHILVIGDQTHETVREMGEKVAIYVASMRSAGDPVLILDNVTRLGHTTSEARAEVARLAKTLSYDRAALVGDGSRAMHFGTNLMLRAIGRSNVRYFGNLTQAEHWLAEKQ